jgi:hypothetical protein
MWRDINPRPRSPIAMARGMSLLSGAIGRHIEARNMTDKSTLELSSKELEVLKEVLEASDSDAPEVTSILERANELSTAAAAETQS